MQQATFHQQLSDSGLATTTSKKPSRHLAEIKTLMSQVRANF
jgi:hypothetical protein